MNKTESLGLDSARLDRITPYFQEKYVAAGKLPGALTLVWRRGEIAHLGVSGHARVETGQKLSEDTIFRIYSMTKPITSIAVMMLMEEGKISLDDPVHRHIPAWRNLRVFEGGIDGLWRTRPTDQPMRIVDLLRHTSGLTYGFQNRTNVDAAYRARKIGEIDKAGTLDTMIEALADVPLEFSPGEKWNYSVSTDVLGYIVEKVSGQKFEDFLRARIFGPLGMNETAFHVPEGQEHRFANCYFAGPGGAMLLQDSAEGSSFLTPPSFVSGGGGLVGTARDYLRFCRMLVNGGTLDGVRYVSPKTLALMSANHLPGGVDLPAISVSLFSEATFHGTGFGLGFAVNTSPAKALLPGTAGDISWGGAASTYFFVDPVEDLIAIFMTQLMPSTAYPLRREFRTLVYSAFC
jgi:CubicO group peptidase (beta-lactamase class C family)